ncbi:hypothetical protein Hanom_Chr06g00518971 [Helianthus anomalus]
MFISFEDKIDASVFVLNVSLWKEWFVSLDIWPGQTLAYERLAWLKFHGVDNGSSIYGSTTIMWRKKKFKVWVLEEQENWVPDCMLEEERLKMNHGFDKVGGKSEEGNVFSSEDEEGFLARSDNEMDDTAGEPCNVLPEPLSPAGDLEQSEELNVGGSTYSVNLGISCDSDDDLNPKVGGDTNSPGGVHRNSRMVSGLDSICNIFNLGRPSMSSRKPRPRNKKSSCCANVSPISDSRHMKRLRDDSEFSFDLNKQAAEGFQSPL